VVRHRTPVTVEEAMEVLSGKDAAALRRFADTVAGHALQLGVYGSTAWDYFANGGYRHEQSDVDIICDVASSAGLSACLAAFSEGTRYFGSALDGEIRFVGGRSVAWRELYDACAGGPSVVLAKSERDVALVSLYHVLSPLR
jgi:phosphoribosyl-dephospho-CoA transferase